MTAQVSQSALPTGTTPTALTPAATDTILEQYFGPNGLHLWVLTAGTITNVSVLDPGRTGSSNPGTVTPVGCPATGTRLIPVPRSAIDPATGFASVTFSAVTGVTYYAVRV
jgi:hypothetical protein